jgi:hypothetical protein
MSRPPYPENRLPILRRVGLMKGFPVVGVFQILITVCTENGVEHAVRLI